MQHATPDMLAALQSFANRKGKGWKDTLCTLWANGRDYYEPEGNTLHEVRNNLGPSWLWDECTIKHDPAYGPGSLTAEFERGRADYLEGRTGAGACPYMATSNCADAWHAGQAFERQRPTDFAPGGKVTHGRGYTVNVAHGRSLPKGRFAKLVYAVDYSPKGATARQIEAR